MAQKKKKAGKRERDRRKKQKAKSVVHTKPEPPDGADTTLPDEPLAPRGLDVTDYGNVSNLSANMGMGGRVTEKVAVDERGRKLRVVMGGEKVGRRPVCRDGNRKELTPARLQVMNEFGKRVDEENEVQARLDRIAVKFNAARAAVCGAGGATKTSSEAERSKAEEGLRQVVQGIDSVMKLGVTSRLVVKGQRKTLYSDGMKLVRGGFSVRVRAGPDC